MRGKCHEQCRGRERYRRNDVEEMDGREGVIWREGVRDG